MEIDLDVALMIFGKSSVAAIELDSDIVAGVNIDGNEDEDRVPTTDELADEVIVYSLFVYLALLYQLS